MNLIDLNDRINLGNKANTLKNVPKRTMDAMSTCRWVEITDDDILLFQSLLNISNDIVNTFNNTDDVNSFLSVFPDIKEICGSNVVVECFYAVKLGYYVKGVPTKLLYILKKAFEKEESVKYPNTILARCIGLIKPYTMKFYETDTGKVTLKDIIENFTGYTIKLLTDSTTLVKTNGYYELWVPDAERVAILPEDIAKMLSEDDCDNIRFDLSKGLVLHDIPLRTFNGRIGITHDEFDLRECY